VLFVRGKNLGQNRVTVSCCRLAKTAVHDGGHETGPRQSMEQKGAYYIGVWKNIHDVKSVFIPTLS
jgi:hypothetical protein